MRSRLAGAWLAALALMVACGPGGSGPAPTAAGETPEAAVPTPPGVSAPTPAPSPSPSPSPSPAATSPGRPTPGELPPDTASLSYAVESGISATVEPLEATCSRYADNFGVAGASRGGPNPTRYQISVAPFRGDGLYRADAQVVEIGGNITVAGLLQFFIGPPFETAAELAGGGALGRLRFGGSGVDGRPVSGVLRWECSVVKTGA